MAISYLLKCSCHIAIVDLSITLGKMNFTSILSCGYVIHTAADHIRITTKTDFHTKSLHGT